MVTAVVLIIGTALIYIVLPTNVQVHVIGMRIQAVSRSQVMAHREASHHAYGTTDHCTGIQIGIGIMVKALLEILGTALIYIVLAMETPATELNAKQQTQQHR